MRIINRKNLVMNLLIAAVFITSVIMPIISLFSRITAEGFREVVGSVQFTRAAGNSLATALTTTVVSLLLAFGAAWCVERTKLPGKNLFSLLFAIGAAAESDDVIRVSSRSEPQSVISEQDVSITIKVYTVFPLDSVIKIVDEIKEDL